MKALRKPLSLFMALLMCLGVFVGTGTTAFAAGETMTTYMIDLPRANDPNKAGWGHPALNFLGGWSTGENDSFSVHTQDAFNGRAIYCIEPGVGVNTGDQYTGRGEDFWDNYPSNLNPTIPPDTIKEYIGRIMTYGWQGNASTSWMSGDPEDASKIAGYIATGAAVIALLLILWTRGRKKEAGILMAVGRSKVEIVLQFLAENLFIAIPAAAVSFGLYVLLADKVGAFLVSRTASDIEGISVVLHSADMTAVYGVGALILILAVLVASVTVIRLKPKAILTQMD